MNTIATSKKSTSLRLTEGLYNHIRNLAKKENRSVNNYIETILFEAVGYHEPNGRTKQSISASLAEKDSLKKYDSVSSMFNDIEDEL